MPPIKNKSEKLKKRRDYYQKNHIVVRRLNRKSEIKREYGLTLDEWDFLNFIHHGKCAICSQPDVRALSVDHDHQTGKVRGMLCSKCNLIIGNLSVEFFERVIAYLRGQL